MLTKAHVEQYREEGYLVVEGVLEGRRRGVLSLDRAGRPASGALLAAAHVDEPPGCKFRQGPREEARVALAGTYTRFSEGFDTADLRAAERLLATLS